MLPHGTCAKSFQSLQYIASQKGHPLSSTILTRTIMDKRYFHGVRTMAAAGLTNCATEDCDWVGLFHLQKIFHELFCLQNTTMMRPNDFSDRAMYFLQCSIPRAMGKIKDTMGEAPVQVKKFFLDKLKFNDNSENEVSMNQDVQVFVLTVCYSSRTITILLPS
jgi:transcription initiation factor TFIID subunit 2